MGYDRNYGKEHSVARNKRLSANDLRAFCATWQSMPDWTSVYLGQETG
jgi:hypothetical protein